MAAGDVAGVVGPNGYRRISVNNNSLYAHRLAWFFHYEKWPEKGSVMDHIDGNKDNNRIANLRIVSVSLNGLNRHILCRRNKSGVTGVRFISSRNRFHAEITIDGKTKFLGSFDDMDSAIKVRQAALDKLIGCGQMSPSMAAMTTPLFAR